MDDTFIIWKHGDRQLDQFLDHINDLRPTIKFTMEKESNGELPFLDVLVKKSENQITTNVYRKPTHTGQYLNFMSNHSHTTKQGVVRSLLDRANKICNTTEGLHKELELVKTDLTTNGY